MAQGYLSSSSRSASTSTFHESQSPNPDYNRYGTTHRGAPLPLRVRSGLRITPLNSAPHSRSHTRSRSHSPSSSASSRPLLLHQDAVEEQDHALESDSAPESALGVLGLRLVRRHEVGNRTIERRGRATVKEDNGEGEEVTSDMLEMVIGGGGLNGHLPTSSNTLPPEGDQQNEPPPQPQSSAPDAFESRLLDVGALTVSWGE
ncbi:hypothetical protein DXG03_001325 [Asterophora parasitica]|uniref:Uncharacterized protein n=1 Tax=Asterophora parasitica TaxID=117018 RepID=A0A9P7G9N1_9AGAR|nr:hypothetical protein DXG03_001325 [Asterophora parasitica]